MLASLLIVFREVMEAGLIVGIVLAASEGVPHRGYWVSIGVGGGVLGASIVAAFASVIAGALEGVGQEVFTAAILMVAVCMLGWHCAWMARHGRELAAQAKALGSAVKGGDKSLAALAVVVAVAVLREGSEVVLFLYGIAISSNEGPVGLLIGGVLGLLAAAMLSYLLYRGLVAIPVRYLFSVTNWLIALLAAGMAGQAAAVLAGADILPSWGNRLWDTSFILSDSGWIGGALHALVGYSARPSGIQISAYVATLTVLIVLTKLVAPVSANKSPKSTASPRPVPEVR
jgi:high-affinity iron transporter